MRNRSFLIRKIALLLPILTVFTIFSYSYAQSLRDIDISIKNEENMLARLRQDRKSAVRQLESIANQMGNYKKLMKALSNEIALNSERIETLRSNISELSNNIKRTKKDIYKSNIFFIDNLGFSEITVVATAKNPSETVKTLEILSRAGKNLEENVKKQSALVFEMERLAAEEKARLEEAKALGAQRKEAIAKLEVENKKYKDTLVLIKNDEAGRKEYLEMLQFQRQSLDDELKRASNLVIRRPKNDGNPIPTHPSIPRGSMVWPSQGIVIEPFGESYIEDAGVTFFHKGIKIQPEKSTPIFAAAEGTVIFADYIKGFDNIIVMDHGDAFYTVYGNLDEMKAQAGEKIQRGGILGRINVDLSNNTSYLYFEIRKNDDALNPADWLAGYRTKINQ